MSKFRDKVIDKIKYHGFKFRYKSRAGSIYFEKRDKVVRVSSHLMGTKGVFHFNFNTYKKDKKQFREFNEFLAENRLRKCDDSKIKQEENKNANS